MKCPSYRVKHKLNPWSHRRVINTLVSAYFGSNTRHLKYLIYIGFYPPSASPPPPLPPPVRFNTGRRLEYLQTEESSRYSHACDDVMKSSSVMVAIHPYYIHGLKRVIAVLAFYCKIHKKKKKTKKIMKALS